MVLLELNPPILPTEVCSWWTNPRSLNPFKVDRSFWHPGPWDAEPQDEVNWKHRGKHCHMRRGPAGQWNGYVQVWGTKASFDHLDVHGGVTFGPSSLPGKTGTWIGFDCAHAWDSTPLISSLVVPGEYRTRQWVMAETERLAEQ